LEGNVRLSTILDLGQKHGIDLPADTLKELKPHVQITETLSDILEYFKKFDIITSILVDYDACRRVIYENVQDALDEGIDYIEIRFSPLFMARPHDLDPGGVVEAVVEGVRQSRIDFPDISVNLLGIISRTYGVEMCHQELDALLAYKDDIAGFDLAGDEINFPATLFVDHFKKARDAGWGITVHAGEADGPESVWHAIQDLGASRIGHGVHIMDDPALIDYVHEKRIGIEVCLTSNVHTSIVPNYSAHPLKRQLDLGLLATINTDNTGISSITLQHEFKVAAKAAGLTPEDTRKAQKNALQIAFLSNDEKQALLERKKM
jgi:adenosine deaminase